MEEFAGYINKITLPNGKTYKLCCEVIEVHPIVCKKCGASFQLKYGEGKCEHCGYDANLSALEFHHKNPEEKEF